MKYNIVICIKFVSNSSKPKVSHRVIWPCQDGVSNDGRWPAHLRVALIRNMNQIWANRRCLLSSPDLVKLKCRTKASDQPAYWTPFLALDEEKFVDKIYWSERESIIQRKSAGRRRRDQPTHEVSYYSLYTTLLSSGPINLLVGKSVWSNSFTKPPDHFGAIRGKSPSVFIRVRVTAVRSNPETSPRAISRGSAPNIFLT